MAWLEGLISGYHGSVLDSREEERKAAEEQQKRETLIYEALLQHDDPNIRAMAGTGLLEAAQPRKQKRGKSWLQGWLGEMEANPTYNKLRQYMGTEHAYPATRTTQGLPSKQGAGNVAPVSPAPQPAIVAPPPNDPRDPDDPPDYNPVPGAGSAALPATSPTEQGAPAQTPVTTVPSPTPQVPGQGAAGGAEPPALRPGQAVAAAVGAATAPQDVAPSAPPPAPPPTMQPATTQEAAQGTPGTMAMSPQPMFQAGIDQPQVPGAPPAPSWRQEAVGPPRVRTQTTEMRRPTFPSEADLTVSKAKATMQGDYESALAMYRELNHPDPEGAAAEYALRQSGGAGGRLIRGGLSRDANGQLVREYLHPTTGQVMETRPELPGQVTSASAPTPIMQVAHSLYGQPGDDAKTTYYKMQVAPDGASKMANVMKRLQYFIAEAPMTNAQKFDATRKLQDDWTAFSKDHRIMVAQMQTMRVAWKAMNAGLPSVPSASEAIIVTFERMLDPTSVVRETEARRPGSMQPWIDQIRTWQQQIRAGGANISIENLKPYVALAEHIVATAEQTMAQERARIQADADQYGLGKLNLLGFQPLPPASSVYDNPASGPVASPPPVPPPVNPAPHVPPTPGGPITLDTTLPPNLRNQIDLNTGQFR